MARRAVVIEDYLAAVGQIRIDRTGELGRAYAFDKRVHVFEVRFPLLELIGTILAHQHELHQTSRAFLCEAIGIQSRFAME
jgi:hypothetical protein